MRNVHHSFKRLYLRHFNNLLDGLDLWHWHWTLVLWRLKLGYFPVDDRSLVYPNKTTQGTAVGHPNL